MGITASSLAILGFAAAGITAIGEIQEAQQRAEAEEFNADVSRQQADMIKARGRLDIMRQKKTAIALRGTQEALYSKSGVVLTGSPLMVIEESAANAELDILLTEFNVFAEESRARSEAMEREMRAKAERRIGYIRAGKTLLTTAAEVALLFPGKKTVPQKKIGD